MLTNNSPLYHIPEEQRFNYILGQVNKPAFLQQPNLSPSDKLIQEMYAGTYQPSSIEKMDVENNNLTRNLLPKSTTMKRNFQKHNQNIYEDSSYKINPIRKSVEMENSFGKISNITKKN